MAERTIVNPSPPRIPDFASRVDPALLPELMDGACSYLQFRDCVRDIGHTSRLTRAYRPTLQFLERAAARTKCSGPLHVIDVGSGGGDMLRRVADWARHRQIPVRLTGIDLNPHATRAAIELSAQSAGEHAVEWLTGDVFTHPETQRPDLVISSLVTHHMRDEEIVRFLAWMEAHALTGWFISDLVRSPRSFQLFRLLASAMRWHPFVQHDGLVSIQRAFREDDWERLLRAADLPCEQVELRRAALGRLCLSRLR